MEAATAAPNRTDPEALFMKRVHRTLVIALAALSLAVMTVPAHAAGLVYASGPGSQAGWTVPAMTMRAGDTITYVNVDLAQHNFIALGAYGSSTRGWCGGFATGSCPIFWSKTVGLGGQAQVFGLDQVVPGTVYTFYCTVHGTVQSGKLIVSPA